MQSALLITGKVAGQARCLACPALPLSRRRAPRPRAAPAAPPPTPRLFLALAPPPVATWRAPPWRNSPGKVAATPWNEPWAPGGMGVAAGALGNTATPPRSCNLRPAAAQGPRGRAGLSRGERSAAQRERAPSRAVRRPAGPPGAAQPGSGGSARTSAGRGRGGAWGRGQAAPAPACPALPLPRGISDLGARALRPRRTLSGERRPRRHHEEVLRWALRPGWGGAVCQDQPFLPEPRRSRRSSCPGSRAGPGAPSAGFGAGGFRARPVVEGPPGTAPLDGLGDPRGSRAGEVRAPEPSGPSTAEGPRCFLSALLAGGGARWGALWGLPRLLALPALHSRWNC